MADELSVQAGYQLMKKDMQYHWKRHMCTIEGKVVELILKEITM
jgi:hypothetical protein